MSMSTNGIGGPHFTQGLDGFRMPAQNKVVSKQNTETVKETKSVDVDVKEPVVQSSIGKTLQYNINDKLDQVVVKVIDPATKETVREIPTPEMQDMKIRIKDAIGNFIDESV